MKKMHTFKFFKRFSYWIFNYLTDRRHFVQIDSNISNTLITNFDVPQGFILGPVLFHLCVTDMTNILSETGADPGLILGCCKIYKKK